MTYSVTPFIFSFAALVMAASLLTISSAPAAPEPATYAVATSADHNG
ncbi:hypothetical protein [Asticcacaulis endophyticus]|uniref:Uncharacterized protein n=1 Tax=Asticcacaulis endophyticus TaxID=1395890 RepID=A0A918Q543_9CAUL|nr:hypothetical protein [Asticcacaulis endophyticus]GGZ33484.1 hypothetical protein GCM10011273_19760 [Asticcacaulis endophyticus]